MGKKYSGKAVKANRELSARSIAVTGSGYRRGREGEKEEEIKAGSRVDLTRRKNDRRGPVGILLVTPTALPHVSFWSKRDTLETEISSLDER